MIYLQVCSCWTALQDMSICGHGCAFVTLTALTPGAPNWLPTPQHEGLRTCFQQFCLAVGFSVARQNLKVQHQLDLVKLVNRQCRRNFPPVMYLALTQNAAG